MPPPAPPERQVPLIAKQPLVMLKPFTAVVVPVLETLKSVVVADAVEDEMRNAIVFGLAVLSERVRRASGEVVPMPTKPVLDTSRFVDVVEPTVNSGYAELTDDIERLPHGVVEATPMFPD